MTRFVLACFAILGVAYYLLSGGSNFTPPEPDAPPRSLSTYDTVLPDPVVEVAPEEAPPPPVQDIRTVTSTRVNLRAGPSTNTDVLGTLVQGDQVAVLETGSDGWVQLEIVGTNITGWTLSRFLSQ